jgi:hypothetical protein
MQSGVCLKGHQNPEGQNYCGICGQILPREGIEIESPDQVVMESRHRRAPARWLVLLALIGAIGAATAVRAETTSGQQASPPLSPTATPTGYVPTTHGDVSSLVPGVDILPPGQTAIVNELWRVTVSGVNRDATQDIEAFSYLNGPPRLGYQYVLVRVNLRNVGDVPRAPSSDLDFSLMTTTGLHPPTDVLAPSDVESIGELFPGASTGADLVFEVMPSQTGELLLSVAGGSEADAQFMAL